MGGSGVDGVSEGNVSPGYASGECLTHGTHGVDAQPFEVGQVPVDVPTAGDHGAGVAVAQGDHDVGGTDDFPGQELGELLVR